MFIEWTNAKLCLPGMGRRVEIKTENGVYPGFLLAKPHCGEWFFRCEPCVHYVPVENVLWWREFPVCSLKEEKPEVRQCGNCEAWKKQPGFQLWGDCQNCNLLSQKGISSYETLNDWSCGWWEERKELEEKGPFSHGLLGVTFYGGGKRFHLALQRVSFADRNRLIHWLNERWKEAHDGN